MSVAIERLLELAQAGMPVRAIAARVGLRSYSSVHARLAAAGWRGPRRPSATIQRMTAALREIARLHSSLPPWPTLCYECGLGYPCATRRLVDAALASAGAAGGVAI